MSDEITLRAELRHMYCTEGGLCGECPGCQRARERASEISQANLTMRMLEELDATQRSIRA